MGVDRYDYLVLGWKMKQEIFEYEFLSDLSFEAPDNIFFPEDEEYAIYGKLVEVSDCITGFDLLEMDVERTVMWLEDYDKLASTFREVVDEELQDWVEHESAKLYLFSILS
jgi:hypothetical protein